MPYASGCLHHVDDHEQLGPSSRSGEPRASFSTPRGFFCATSDACFPSSSPRSWSPTEATARCSVTGRRYPPAFTHRVHPCRCVWIQNNWVSVSVQFRLVMHYLSEMSEEQTLVMYSGHPMGLFPSLPSSPRAIITNGMVTAQRASSTCVPVAHETPFPSASLRLSLITPPELSMRRCLPSESPCEWKCDRTTRRQRCFDNLRYFFCQVWSNDGGQLLLHWTSGDRSWHDGTEILSRKERKQMLVL